MFHTQQHEKHTVIQMFYLIIHQIILYTENEQHNNTRMKHTYKKKKKMAQREHRML